MTLYDDAQSALRAVRDAPIIAFDTETSGVDWKRNVVVGYVITVDINNNWYIPVRHAGGGNLMDNNVAPITEPTVEKHDVHWFERELADAFRERNRRGLITVGHNTKFDMHMAMNHGISLGRTSRCTQISEAMINEHAGSYSLDSCAKRHGVTPKRAEPMYEHLAARFGGKAEPAQMANFWRLSGDDDIANDYAKGDGITTLELWFDQQKVIDEPCQYDGRSMRGVHDMEQDLMWTVFKMERRGIKVNQNRLDEVIDILAKRTKEAYSKLPPNFNVRSPRDMKAWLESIGRTDWPLTEKGAPSFAQKWLKSHPDTKPVVDVRELLDLKSKFIDPLIQTHIFNGRVHSSLNQLKADEYGTITGRFSSSNPNMQQVPKRNKDLGRLFRSIFVPDEGKIFYEGDYSQCEPRLFAHYTESPKIMAGYQQEPFVDMHTVLAEELKVERDPTAKRMNMGLLTGMYPPTFASHMNWPIEKAKPIWDWYRGEFFPELAEFHELARKVYKMRGYVKTLLGRFCHLHNPQLAYQAVSRIIQGGNADITKYKLLQADRFIEDSGADIELLMTVHDSFEWQASAADTARVDEMVRNMADVQTPPFNLKVPFLVEVGSGPNWAIATYGEPK